jgi:hypothetical protein
MILGAALPPKSEDAGRTGLLGNWPRTCTQPDVAVSAAESCNLFRALAKARNFPHRVFTLVAELQGTLPFLSAGARHAPESGTRCRVRQNRQGVIFARHALIPVAGSLYD